MKYTMFLPVLLSSYGLLGQDISKPAIRGELELPVQLGNRDFKNFTESVVNLDICFQYPLIGGFGIGVGGKGAFHSVNAGGDIYRGVGYLKAFYDHRLSESTLFETSVKVGGAMYSHQADACSGSNSQEAAHFDFGLALHFFANEFTSFGITLGYEIDGAAYGSELVCSNAANELYTNEGGNYRFLNIGLGFNVLLGSRPASGPGNVFD